MEESGVSVGTFAEDIEGVVASEPIEAVVIGLVGGDSPWPDAESRDYGEDYCRAVPRDKKGIILMWEQARPLLDYDYDRGYGGPECHAVAVYTPTRVVFVSQYDGATGVESLPRNPCNFWPPMPGG